MRILCKKDNNSFMLNTMLMDYKGGCFPTPTLPRISHRTLNSHLTNFVAFSLLKIKKLNWLIYRSIVWLDNEK